MKSASSVKKCDTIALISISGGRAGDEDMLYRYEIEKKCLEEIWGIYVIATSSALAGLHDLIKFLKYEAHREDIPVSLNADFVHRTPMTIIPMGAMAEIDCNHVMLKI